MKRLLVAMLVLAALPLAAADKPGDAYRRGVEAVRAKNYAAGAELGKWDRKALECGLGVPGRPRVV